MSEVDSPVSRVKKTTKITLSGSSNSSSYSSTIMNESDSGYSVTSESPPENSEAGPDIAGNEDFLCTSLEYFSQRGSESLSKDVDAPAPSCREETYAKKNRKLSHLRSAKQEEMESLKLEMERRRDSEEQMKKVLAEYEKTIGELISEKEKEKKRFEEEISRLTLERNQATEDLRNVETAFADVHRKYERSKQVVDDFKKNEEALKHYLEEYKIKLKKQETKFELLKDHAEETLEKANNEIENITKAQNSEVIRISALLRKTEMKTSSLEKIVDQKVKENEELANICDELISKVAR